MPAWLGVMEFSHVRVRSVIFFVLLAFISASGSQVSGNRSSRRSLRIERRLVALAPSEDSAVAAPVPPPDAPTPSTSAPPPSSNTRPAMITPSANAPGTDLPPKHLHAPPPSRPLVAPISSPGSSAKQTNTAAILGVILGVVVVLLVSVSAIVFFKPHWLPCCKDRNSRITQYERHVPT